MHPTPRFVGDRQIVRVLQCRRRFRSSSRWVGRGHPTPRRSDVSAVSDPAETRTTAQVRARTSDTFVERMASIKETKPSFMSTEFWLMIIGVAGLIGLYNYTDNPSLDL